jgi:hypothetical protein
MLYGATSVRLSTLYDLVGCGGMAMYDHVTTLYHVLHSDLGGSSHVPVLIPLVHHLLAPTNRKTVTTNPPKFQLPAPLNPDLAMYTEYVS